MIKYFNSEDKNCIKDISKLSRVYKMAEIIAKSIYNSVKLIYKESPQ